MKRRSWAEPYKIKSVEPLRTTCIGEREAAMAAAGFNPFLLRGRDVYIDLLTDSGTAAMSDRQWAALMLGKEAGAGSSSCRRLEAAARGAYGFPHVIPTHQGRGAEHLLSRIVIRPGDRVPGNMYFCTTRHHQELAGGIFEDVSVEEAHDPDSDYPFKGNVDLAKLRTLVERVGAGRIAYLSLETNMNQAGGQPLSLANLRETCAACRDLGIRVFLDATRALENAWFIRRREPGQEHRTLAGILRDLCDPADGAHISAKKDFLVSIGGLLLLRDGALAEEARSLCAVFEGLPGAGGLAGRDLEAMAAGIEESLLEQTHRARIGQVAYLADRLLAAGIPIVRPTGSHAVFLNAARFLPHVPREQFPAQALAAALYVESGVRAMEQGAVAAGRDPATGRNVYPTLELVRLAIPRRVYTQAHMDVVAESIIALHEQRDRIAGLRFVHEPRRLRFFQSRFEPVGHAFVLRRDRAAT